ncbi:hypothetical protein [Sphingomonas sp.]|uniref:hypothetical protein n=1 Tax=Sphingomonas sp. TaxID=28214 RepID=UPI003B008DA6
MYSVSVDRTRAMIRMTASGFFTMPLLEASAAELHAAIRSLGTLAGRHVTLYDYRGLKVVQKDVLDRYGRYFTDTGMTRLWARRVAFVTDSALLGFQLQRIRRENMRVFADPDEATAWLLEVQDDLPASAQAA